MAKAGASPGARLRIGVLVAAVGAFMVLGPAAIAKPRPQPQPSPLGYDVSYPQCGKTLPAATFGIVGVNAGIVFSPNPCLGVGDGPSELGWAQQAANHAPAFYANTGDPGPAYSSHWPTGQTAPQFCDGAAANAPSCSYDYGWNAAADSFHDAVVAEQQVNGTNAADATAAAAQAVWWLDVETGNSWQTLESAYGQTAVSRGNDVAALDGAVAYLQSAGVSTVGFYSTAYQWTQITGGTGTHFAASPSWIAGFTSASAAQSGCSTTGFTGGKVQLTQYTANGLDADHVCT
jgi:hypothetical protein